MFNRLFKWFKKPSKSHVKWDDCMPIAYETACVYARHGFKIRCIDWPKGKYVFYSVLNEDFFVVTPSGEGMRTTKAYTPTDSDQYGGVKWRTCGKVE